MTSGIYDAVIRFFIPMIIYWEEGEMEVVEGDEWTSCEMI